MSDSTPQDPPADHDAEPLAEDRDAEEIVDEEIPLDVTGPTEFGEAVD